MGGRSYLKGLLRELILPCYASMTLLHFRRSDRSENISNVYFSKK